MAAVTMLLLSSPLATGRAQQHQVETGDVVRFVFTADGSARQGTLSRLTPDSLLLDECYRCKPLAYGKSDALGLESYRGSTRPRNALLGFLGGALIGALGSVVDYNTHSCKGDLCGLRAITYSYAVLGGSLVGMLVGIAVGKEKWEPVDWPRPQ